MKSLVYVGKTRAGSGSTPKSKSLSLSLSSSMYWPVLSGIFLKNETLRVIKCPLRQTVTRAPFLAVTEYGLGQNFVDSLFSLCWRTSTVFPIFISDVLPLECLSAYSFIFNFALWSFSSTSRWACTSFSSTSSGSLVWIFRLNNSSAGDFPDVEWGVAR